MKLTALFLIFIIWCVILLLIKVNIRFSYSYRNFESDILIGFNFLFSHLKIELKVSKEMLSSGTMDLITNLVVDVFDKEDNNVKKSNRLKRNLKRYYKAKMFAGEIIRHYVFSWSVLISLRKKLSIIAKRFYKKINLISLSAVVRIGGRDAAETGMLTGVFWAMFGRLNARCYQIFKVRKNNIDLKVIPCFDSVIFLCNLNCILSLKISHIIFTVIKFLSIILKYRRNRSHGRTSN